MVSREDMGSWLGGGPAPAGGPRGSRLGLPEAGPDSMASTVRRVVALLVDWAAATAISYLFADGDPWATLAIFALENLILVSTVGYTLGHRLLGLQVRVLGDRSRAPVMVGFGRGAIRTFLLCLVIPAVIWDADGRGLHDKAAGTVIVRR